MHMLFICNHYTSFLAHRSHSVTEIKANEEFTVGFASDNRQMVLEVFLSANFPNEKPKIVITPRIQHEWIPDPATGEIQNAPGLLSVSWTICDLNGYFLLLIAKIEFVIYFFVSNSLPYIPILVVLSKQLFVSSKDFLHNY